MPAVVILQTGRTAVVRHVLLQRGVGHPEKDCVKGLILASNVRRIHREGADCVIGHHGPATPARPESRWKHPKLSQTFHDSSVVVSGRCAATIKT